MADTLKEVYMYTVASMFPIFPPAKNITLEPWSNLACMEDLKSSVHEYNH